MKFSCTQLALLKAINIASKAVSSRTTVPVLKGFLLKVEDNRLTVTASDLDLSIETSIDVQSYEDGSVVVPAKLFSDIIRKLPNTIINVEEEASGLVLHYNQSLSNVVTMSADEYPAIGEIENNDFIDIEKEVFSSLIKKTAFAASIDEKRGVLTGVLANFENGNIEFVALDGFRLAIARKAVDTGINKRIIIPARMLAEISRIITDDNGSDKISLVIEDKRIEILTEDTRIIARLLEGEYIKYKEIIPTSGKTRITISREDLLNGLERASLVIKENKNKLVKFTIEDSNLTLSSRSDEGNINELIGIDKEGDDLIIGFNANYFIEALKVINDDEIVIQFGSNVNPSLVLPVDGDEFTFLILPVRI